MVTLGATVLVSMPDGSGVVARVEETTATEMRLATVPGELAACGMEPGQKVSVEYTVVGDATYRTDAIVTMTDGADGRLVIRQVDTPVRVQARRFVRLDVALKVRLSLIRSDREQRVIGTFAGNDLSAGGLSLRLPAEHEVPVDSVVSCCFDLPTRQGPLTVMTDAVVVRRDGEDCGLAFKPLAPRLEQAIVAAVNWHIVRRRVA